MAAHGVLVLVLVHVMVLGDVSASAQPPPHTLDEAARRLDAVLNNTRSRENYVRCFMDRGICNKEALSIKKILTEALTANCSNCTQAQKLGADRFFEYLQSNQKEAWDKLTDKYGKEDDDDDSDDSDDDDDDDKGRRPPGVPEGGPHNNTTSPTPAATANVTTSTISIIF